MEGNGPFAIVHPGARIGQGVAIGPYAYIEEDVVIGDGTWIGPHACIMNGSRIGSHCRIFPGAVISAIPQDLKFDGEYTTVDIGDHVTVREYCTINKGTKANNTTQIGSHCLLMAYVHVAHDCIVDHHVILANSVNLAGHVEVGAHAVLGGMTAVHQFVKIGTHVMISGGSMVTKDVPPYVKAAREPLSFTGVNTIGLKRRGFSIDQIHRIQDIYRVLFLRGYNTSQALHLIEEQLPDSSERYTVLDFIRKADRGIMRGFNHVKGARENGNRH